jgi:hypothetical protein
MGRLKGIVLLFAIQLILVAATTRAEMAHIESLATSCWFAMMAVPWIGYIIVLYHAPTRLASSPVGRIALLTVLSFCLSFFGAMVNYVLLGFLGMPARG